MCCRWTKKNQVFRMYNYIVYLLQRRELARNRFRQSQSPRNSYRQYVDETNNRTIGPLVTVKQMDMPKNAKCQNVFILNYFSSVQTIAKTQHKQHCTRINSIAKISSPICCALPTNDFEIIKFCFRHTHILALIFFNSRREQPKMPEQN